jgi:hypothetical protein
MHTQEQAGINVARADILLETFTLNTPTTIEEDLEDDEPITAEEIEAEFAKLGDQAFARQDGDGLAPDVGLEQVYDVSELDNIRGRCHTYDI